MTPELDGFGKKLDAKWVKADSGVTYLCPEAIIDFLDEFSEEDLKAICVPDARFGQIN